MNVIKPASSSIASGAAEVRRDSVRVKALVRVGSPSGQSPIKSPIMGGTEGW